MKIEFRPLIQKLLSIKPLALFSLGLRSAAMLGKFSFILVAAVKMTPADLGRFGVAMSLSILIPITVGIEVYQILCRSIANGQASDDDKRSYAAFAISASVVAFAATYVSLMAMHWRPIDALACSGVIVLEYLGTELFRVLVAEGRRLAALQSFSIRSGLWSLGLPALSFAHLMHGGWSLTLVIMSWLVSDVIGLIYAISLPPVYRPGLKSFIGLISWLRPMLPASMAWLAIQAAWRFIDSGPKLLAGIFLTPAEAGHFTFLNTIAGIPSVVIRGVVEPLLFVELAVVTNIAFRRRYGLLLTGIGIGSTALAAVLLFGASVFTTHKVTPVDWFTFGVLSVGTIILNLSQAPHFVLYANRRDRLIFYVSFASFLVAAPVCCLAAWLGGRFGLSFGILFVSTVLLVVKWVAARFSVPGEYLSRDQIDAAELGSQEKLGAEA